MERDQKTDPTAEARLNSQQKAELAIYGSKHVNEAHEKAIWEFGMFGGAAAADRLRAERKGSQESHGGEASACGGVMSGSAKRRSNRTRVSS
jgi:hypothetical protein